MTTTFSERLNTWLVEQGREPWPKPICEALDEGAAQALVKLEGYGGKLGRAIRDFMAGMQVGMKENEDV